jgi:glycosyltransferase involved in cell wall biosynthesis
MPKNKIPTIALCAFVKNEERNIRNMINSVTKFVSEIHILDNGSTDGTLDIAREFGANIKTLATERITDFSKIRNAAFHDAISDWILMLDGDEMLCLADRDLIIDLVSDNESDAWFLPRYNFNADGTIDESIYPDWQGRLFRNNGVIRYERPVHEGLTGFVNIKFAHDGPHINHYNRIVKTPEQIARNHEQYVKISALNRLEIYET